MEDLVHFIMTCNAYQNERADLIHILKESYKRNYNKMTDMENAPNYLVWKLSHNLLISVQRQSISCTKKEEKPINQNKATIQFE